MAAAVANPVARELRDHHYDPTSATHTETHHAALPSQTPAEKFATANKNLDYDVLVIGAGLSGIASLYKFSLLGLRVKAFETGSAEGGTWYWNRYPGARFDSESWSYGFSFSQEVLDEWDWTEHFAAQPETLRYAQYLADRFDVRKYMQFDTTITSARYQDSTSSWLLIDQHGRTYTTRFLVTAMGILNNCTLPNIPGVHDFKGPAFHTSRWPHDDTKLDGKRVGIIGTGATGIQVIQTIASRVGSLKVFQRTANWSAPLRNGAITKEEMQEIRQRYQEIFKACSESAAGFVHKSTTLNTLEMSPEERLKTWEALYAQPGFSKFLGVNVDIFTNREANALYSDFMAEKIRQRINDPKVAEKLIPKTHGFGTRRLPLESGYFEVFNQPNVELIDIVEDPIQRITQSGICTKNTSYDLDVIIYATGFDAVTGSFRAVDFRGRDDIKLVDVWSEGIRTYLGLTVKDFPNMFMVMGPHQAFGNFPRSIEYAVQWVADCVAYAQQHCITRIEPTQEKVDEWTDHVHECGKGLLANEIDSWMTGVNKNLAHKQKRSMTRYNGPGYGYRQRADEVRDRQYADIVMSGEAL